jgi:hypothetical protein
MNFKSLIIKVSSLIKPVDEPAETLEAKPFSEEQMVEEAHQALIEAQNLFARVEDPDMIDYAIYSMKAAEERFDFLVKAIKSHQGQAPAT